MNFSPEKGQYTNYILFVKLKKIYFKQIYLSVSFLHNTWLRPCLTGSISIAKSLSKTSLKLQ